MPLDKKLIERIAGRFIVLDGPDGAGKSTLCQRLATELAASGLDVLTCRDPGGTAIGNRIRSVLLDHDLSTMSSSCETLLFMASRAQLVKEVIRPALASGKTVVCDRYVSSTCAYQGAVGVAPEKVIDLARFATDELWPDVTIVIDVDPELGMSRIGTAEANKSNVSAAASAADQRDAMERRSMEFHRRVRDGYRALGSYYPAPIVYIDGNANADAVFERFVDALATAFAES